ncbi:MAG TPA: peptidoglycan DD-metalloendopeptidase family protein, partial [Euzebya sp.]|nr:peptidoglycan DD-metalloendopeptidase family protein [Euzebya sp.]
ELAATETRLADTRAELESLREAYEARVRQSYISARPDQTLPIFSVTNAADFTQATTYLEAIVSRDRAGYEQVDVLRATIEADEAELARLQDQHEADREVAEAERDHVASLVAEQQSLVAQVDAAAGEKRTVLAGLEADRESAEALIAEFEAESARIEAELAAAAAAAAAEAAAAAAAQQGSPASASGTAGVVAGSGRFILPVGGRISSEFGYRIHPISGASRLHAGIDIAAPGGTPIGAAGAGTVVSVGWRGGYGNAVIIDHGGGIATLYAHQSRTAASVGQSVSQGQIIGYVGTTGYSTGNHLHWEVRVNGAPTNPRGYL